MWKYSIITVIVLFFLYYWIFHEIYISYICSLDKKCFIPWDTNLVMLPLTFTTPWVARNGFHKFFYVRDVQLISTSTTLRNTSQIVRKFCSHFTRCYRKPRRVFVVSRLVDIEDLIMYYNVPQWTSNQKRLHEDL